MEKTSVYRCSEGLRHTISNLWTCNSRGGETFKYSNILRDYIYSFHMALFFVVSGILIGHQLKDGVNISYIKKRICSYIQSLLIPYYSWSVIYFILDNKSINHDIYEWFLCIITFRGRAPIWFLGALFWAEVLAIYIVYISKQRKNVIAITVTVSIVSIISWKQYEQLSISSVFIRYSVISLFRGVVCLLFVLVGYIVSSMIIKNEKKLIIGIKLCVLTLLNLCIYGLFGGESNLHTFSIGNMYAFLLEGISGSCMLLFLCKFICKIINLRNLKWIGQHSLGIMCLHYTHLPFMQYATDICNYIGFSGGGGAFIVSFAFVLVSSILGIIILKKVSCRM